MKRRRALSLLGAGAIAGGFALGAARHTLGERVASGQGRDLQLDPEGRHLDVYYLDAYTGSAHAFETTRKARWIADTLRAAPMAGIRLRSHAALAPADLLRVHAPGYVDAVRTGEPRALAESQGFPWDTGLWPMVLASNGGALAAARAARAQGGIVACLASGLHHARRGQGVGFCTFNGLALAALDAADAGARVLVIDLDAHCGGGTHSLVGGHPRVQLLDIAVNAFDRYVPETGNSLDLVASADQYLPMIERRLSGVDQMAFDLCLYNAGMDPHQGSAVGGLAGVDAALLKAREQRVFRWCAERVLPVACVMAGGYLGPGLDREGLVSLHLETLSAALDAQAPDRPPAPAPA